MGATAIQVQSIIDGTDAAAVMRSLRSVENALCVWRAQGGRGSIRVLHVDLNDTPLFSPSEVSSLVGRFSSCFEYGYSRGTAAEGKAAALNALAQSAEANYLLFLDATTVASPMLIVGLMRPFDRFDIRCGATEARSIPVDLCKSYDEQTGCTSWCSWRCLMAERDAFDAVGGFEDLLKDGPADVDLSWRMRLAGYSLVYVPEVSFFCPVDASPDGIALPRSPMDALGLLLMAYRWNYEMLGQKLLMAYELANDEAQRRAAADFRELKASGRLPERLDPCHVVAEIDERGRYGR